MEQARREKPVSVHSLSVARASDLWKCDGSGLYDTIPVGTLDIDAVNSLNHIACSKPSTFRQAASLYAIHNGASLRQKREWMGGGEVGGEGGDEYGIGGKGDRRRRRGAPLPLVIGREQGQNSFLFVHRDNIP
jgi:hypothetical protein